MSQHNRFISYPEVTEAEPPIVAGPDNPITIPEEAPPPYSSKLLGQLAVTLGCLLLLYLVTSSRHPWLQWTRTQFHQAINASMEETFGLISRSSSFKLLVRNCSKLIRLKEVTKELSNRPENNAGLTAFKNAVWPVSGNVIQGYGWQINPISKKREFFSGIEIEASPDEQVMALADGEVIDIARDSRKGWLVMINHGFGWVSIYRNLDRIPVRVNQRVKAGTVIGRLIESGSSIKSRLRLEVKHNEELIDPLSILVS